MIDHKNFDKIQEFLEEDEKIFSVSTMMAISFISAIIILAAICLS